MSAPAFVWAVEQGRLVNLTPSQRLVLIVLADRANGKRVCWPSLEQLSDDTGLVKRTVFTVVHQLAEAGLIRIERRGRKQDYHILRPDDGGVSTQPLHRSRGGKVQPLHQSSGTANGATTAPIKPEPTQPLHQSAVDNSDQLVQSAQGSVQPFPRIGATIATQPVRNLSKNLTREKGSDVKSNSGTDPAGETEPLGGKIDTSEFYRELAKRRAAAAAVQTIVAKTTRALCSTGIRPDTKYAEHSVEEQIEANLPPRPAPEIPPGLEAVVRAARRDLAQRAAQRARVAA